MERPILFSGEMVRAILDGRKTQTRRVIKLQSGSYVSARGNGVWQELLETSHPTLGLPGKMLTCPYGRPGDTLWVRETWQAQSGNDGRWWHEVEREERSLHNWAWTNPVRPAYDNTPPKWLPSIHMPRLASRLTLRVVNVRVERVQDISQSDAIAEGIERGGATPRHAFNQLWDSINAKRGYSWDSNPWVWVVEFEVITP